MLSLDKRLLFLALALIVITGLFSCSQPDDIITSVSRTTLHLTAELLPEPPEGMVYELWVAVDVVSDTAIASNRIVSLGKFSFMTSDTLVAFLDANGNLRADSNQFVLNGDLYEYRSMFVSVETVADPYPTRPGPIMLMGVIVPLKDVTPTLNFPLSEDLWRATVRYNMEAVSDNDRNANDGEGIWFSFYRTTRDTIPDTTALTITVDSVEIIPDTVRVDSTVFAIDTTIDSSVIPYDTTIDTTFTYLDTLNLDSIYASRPYEILNIDTLTQKILYGPDTLLLNIDSFMHRRVTFEVDSLIDSIPPFYKRVFTFNYTIRDHTIDPTRIVTYDIFTQQDYDLPDYSAWGWKYKGWVVTPYVLDGFTGESFTGGRLTPPAWKYKSASRNWIPGDTGGVITTGTFTDIAAKDDSDPFTLKHFAGLIPILDTITGDTTWDTLYKRPRYPGEDFLDSDSLQAKYGLSQVDLMPGSQDGNVEGTVFISLEPANRLTTTTNFPLIVFTGEVPRSYAALAGQPAPFVVNMMNLSSSVIGSLGPGFPEIRVKYERL